MDKDIKNYIRNLAVNNWEMNPDDIIEFIEQLELEEVIEIKKMR